MHDFLLAWAERAGHSLTEEQSAGIVANAAAWLEEQDQGFLEYVETCADDLAAEENPQPKAAG